jgi:hypothetical protein
MMATLRLHTGLNRSVAESSIQRLMKYERLGVVSKQVSSASRIADKALGPPRTCPLSLQAPGPARTLYKAISATRGCPGLSLSHKSR